MRLDSLRQFLEVNNLKQKEVADYLGISRSHMSNVIHGSDVLSHSKLAKLYSNDQGWDVSMFREEIEKWGRHTRKDKIPLYNDVASIGGMNEVLADVDSTPRPTEWINPGDWFPSATSAIHHYGDSMVEYPSGCILALKRVNDPSLLISGANYVIETAEYRITKQIQDEGDFIMAYSTNRETYPDGHLIHSPIRIPKESIRHMDLVLGCVIKKFSTPINIR